MGSAHTRAQREGARPVSRSVCSARVCCRRDRRRRGRHARGRRDQQGAAAAGHRPGAGLVGARRPVRRRRAAGDRRHPPRASRTRCPRRWRRTSATARCCWSRVARPGTGRSGRRCGRWRRTSRRATSMWSRSTTAPARWPVPRCWRPCWPPPASTVARSPPSRCHRSSGPESRPATELHGVQTPQAFRAAVLLEAYRRADDDGFDGTDTAACVARYTHVRGGRGARQPAQPEDHLPRGRRPSGAAGSAPLAPPRRPAEVTRRADVGASTYSTPKPVSSTPHQLREVQRGQGVQRRHDPGRQHDRRRHGAAGSRGRRSRRPRRRVTTLTVSVTGRTPTTTVSRSTARTRHSAMKLPGVIGQRLSWSTNGSPPSTRPAHSVPRSTGVTPDSPSAHAAHATSASPWMSENGSEPRPSSITAPSASGWSSMSSP